MIVLKETERGFKRGEFKDHYGKQCRIQESSLAEPASIWLGIRADSMHLNQDAVADLIPLLQHFVEHGYLPAATEQASIISPECLALINYNSDDPSTYLDPEMHPELAGHPFIKWKT